MCNAKVLHFHQCPSRFTSISNRKNATLAGFFLYGKSKLENNYLNHLSLFYCFVFKTKYCCYRLLHITTIAHSLPVAFKCFIIWSCNTRLKPVRQFFSQSATGKMWGPFSIYSFAALFLHFLYRTVVGSHIIHYKCAHSNRLLKTVLFKPHREVKAIMSP